MSQNMEQTVRTREEQVAALAKAIGPEKIYVLLSDEYRAEIDARALQHITEAEARGATEERVKVWDAIKSKCHVAFSKVEVGDIIAFAHPQNDAVKAFCPYIVVPNNPDKPYDLVRFSLYGDGTYLYQQNARSWRDDGGYIIHRPANVAALEAKTERRFQHIKRGTEYRLIGRGKIQQNGPSDMAEVVIYQDVNDGSFWVRSPSEFYDGRFKEIFDALTREGGV